MNKNEFRKLYEERILLLDGAVGTNLQDMGMPTGVSPEQWAIENSAVLIKLQRAYLEAGANIIYTFTFGGSSLKLESFGLSEKTQEINEALACISRQAVEQSGQRAYVAGDLAPTGRLIAPAGDTTFEEIVDAYKIQVKGLLAGGVDLFVIETMLSIQEARAALLAVRESCDLPVMVSMTYEANGKTLTGTDPATALVTLQSMGADAVGINCSSGPELMIDYLRQMKPYAKVPLFVKPNAGLPVLENGRTIFSMDAHAFAGYARELAAAGANLIGGCCGTNPVYIAKVKAQLTGLTPSPVENKGRSLLSSGGQLLDISNAAHTLIVGERINPTGKKRLQNALLAADLDMISDLARDQMETGADILDVNLGMAGIDEADMMREVVSRLNVTVNLPLCIDSPNPKAIEAGLRAYQGRALVNSVSLEEKKLREILPVAAHYGAMILVLPLSDKGIPQTAEGRKEIVEKVYTEAQKFGYGKEDIIIDGLVMTVSSDQESGAVTLETIKWCHEEFKVHTIIGLSNISFGLPQRNLINSAFLSLAVYHGLTMAIANPSDKEVMDMKHAADVLSGRDTHALHFISAHAPKRENTGGKEKEATSSTNEKTLGEKAYDAVVKGEQKTILPLVGEILESGMEPKALIENYLIPAINQVGDLYEKGRYFLPQLVLSAQTMETAFEYLQPYLLKQEGGGEDVRIKIILATVKGDIHDIGKNIVKIMLKNNGFTVIDLGKDVSAETIVETAISENVDIVGLSALMTTTMMEMEHVIEKLREAGAACKVIVGGAVITEAFAKKIGADGYSGDAAHAVKIVKTLTATEKV